LEYARGEFERAQQAKESLSRARFADAQQRLRKSEADYDIARIKLQRAEIRAPFTGVIAQLDIDPGEVVAPGQPIARLVKLDPVVISVAVSDRDVVHLRAGQSANVHLDAFPEGAAGRIARVFPVADINTRAFTVEVEVPNPSRLLLPGMIARIQLDVEVAEQVITLPQDVVVTTRTETGVFILDGNKARWRPVVLGHIVRDQVMIDDGLIEGDIVVTTGHRSLADGDVLIVARQGTCCDNGRIVFK
jgi:membrane fusion protein (multidrug efflux system)